MVADKHRTLLSVDDAIERLLTWEALDRSEMVPLSEANGRVLSEVVSTPYHMPPFDNSAMDGFAFRFADLPHDRRLKLAGRVSAGQRLETALSPGQAARIFTGAPMPPGADTIALQEHCAVAGDAVIMVPQDLRSGANCRRQGEDVLAGETILAPGGRLRPADIAMAAASGRTELLVRKPLRVAIASTGDELQPG